MNTSTSLRHIVRSQAGVVSRSQAARCELTSAQIHRRLAAGDLIRIHPGVYRLATAIPTPESSLWAAALWVGGRGLLTGMGAAWWWEMSTDPPPEWQFIVPGSGPTRSRPGVRAMRRFVDPADLTERRGLPITSRPLTILRGSVELERLRPGKGIAMIDRTKQRGWLTQAQLEATYERHRGTWGSRTMRTLLDRTGDRAHSELERHGVRELRAAGITDFVLNHETTLVSGRTAELDVAFLRLKVALEFDGFAYHAGAEEHRSDIRRANDIMASGWLLRRFSWSDVIGDPDGFVQTVCTALAARGGLQ